MPRPHKGGKKKSRGKRHRIKKGPLVLKDTSINGSQLYGVIKQRLGGKPAYVLVKCEDGEERRCVIRGKFTKRVWMNPNDIVLINYDKNSSDLKGEIELKYNPGEVNKLKQLGVLSDILFGDKEEDDNIIFGESKPVSLMDDKEDNLKLDDDLNLSDDEFFDISTI